MSSSSYTVKVVRNPSCSSYPWNGLLNILNWANLGTKKLCGRWRISLLGTTPFVKGTEEALSLLMFDCWWDLIHGASIINTPMKTNTPLYNVKCTHNWAAVNIYTEAHLIIHNSVILKVRQIKSVLHVCTFLQICRQWQQMLQEIIFKWAHVQQALNSLVRAYTQSQGNIIHWRNGREPWNKLFLTREAERRDIITCGLRRYGNQTCPDHTHVIKGK